MNLFSIIPDGVAIVHCRGVYRQVPIYARGGKIYAKHGGGFVRLGAHGDTSAPNIRWSDVDAGEGAYEARNGHLEYTPPVESAGMGVAAE